MCAGKRPCASFYLFEQGRSHRGELSASSSLRIVARLEGARDLVTMFELEVSARAPRVSARLSIGPKTRSADDHFQRSHQSNARRSQRRGRLEIPDALAIVIEASVIDAASVSAATSDPVGGNNSGTVGTTIVSPPNGVLVDFSADVGVQATGNVRLVAASSSQFVMVD